jgi:copper homeostasis protein (lipoprotein)
MKSTTVAFGVILLLSCQTQKTTTSDNASEEMKNPDAAHTSQNVLDWDGVYRGVLPCADCEGIQTTVELKKDLSFKTKTIYLGKSDSVYEANGKISWNEKGNAITLTPSDKGEATQYFVGEGVLTQLDKQGNKIKSDNATRYLLSKLQYEILEKYWTLVELNGRGVAMDSTFIREPHIIFKSGGSRIIGNGGCNGFSGEYKIESLNHITMSKILSTRMACPKMDLEGEFLDVLQKADNFNIAGDSLTLNKARMAPLARFKAVYLK